MREKATTTKQGKGWTNSIELYQQCLGSHGEH